MPLCGASMSVLRLLEARSFADVEGGAYWWLLQACLAEYVPWPYQGRRGGHPWVEVAQGFQRYVLLNAKRCSYGSHTHPMPRQCLLPNMW